MPKHQLMCNHIFRADVKPNHGDTVWCFPCGKYSLYNDYPGNYSLRCMQCKFAKLNGGKLAMECAASKHKATKKHKLMLITPQNDVIMYIPLNLLITDPHEPGF